MNIEKDALLRGFNLKEWEVRPLAGSLRKGTYQVHVEPRVMDVMLCLARHQGEVVTRDALLDEVWGKVIVSDDAINRCISELRTVLGDTDREKIYIRTIPRRGYSLIAPVEPLYPAVAGETDEEKPWLVSMAQSLASNSLLTRAAVVILGPVLIMLVANFIDNRQQSLMKQAPLDTASTLQAAPADPVTTRDLLAGKSDADAAPGEIRSLAVLPFLNISGNPDHEYFSDGLSEDIRNTLMSATSLRVAARTSSSVFKNKPMDVRTIGEQLNVDALLEGTVRINGDHLRITTQLTDARNGYSIWAASYERDTEDKLALQTEIAGEIARQLAPTLQIDATVAQADEMYRGATENVEAHDYYHLGRHHWHKRTADALEQAVDYFNKALELDPDYALAYSGLADALVFQTTYGPLAMDEVREQAVAAIDRALELEPDLAEAHASRGMFFEKSGQPEQARNAYRKAVELKPQYSMAHMWLGNSWLDSRHVEKAHDHYRDALRIDPLHPKVQFNYAHALMMQGRYEEALNILEEFSRTNPSDKFIKLMIESRLALGQFDEVLNLVAGHSFSSEYKPYTDRIVVEALIQLGDEDKAERIVLDNRNVMNDWQVAWIKGSIAVARRDGKGILELSEFMGSEEFDKGKHMPPACAGLLVSYLQGMSAYLDGNFEKVGEGFSDFHGKVARGDCAKLEPEIEIAALIYHGDSLLQLDGNDTRAGKFFQQAFEKLASLRKLGWNTPTLAGINVALLHMTGETDRALQMLEQMVDKGWQPFGFFRTSPMFDRFLASPRVASQLVSLDDSYQEIKEQCEDISLAKLGL